MQKKRIARDLTVGRVTPTLLLFAYPVMISNFLQTAYNMVDMAIVGRFVGSDGLAAVSVGGDVIHFFTFLGMGFATAGQIMISQYVGAGKKNELNKVIGTLFTFILSLGAFLSIIGLTFSGSFLRLLNIDVAAYDGALAYTLTSSAGMMFVFGYNMLSATLRGMGDSRHPMMFIGFAAIMNTVLDIIFIAVFKLGAMGAALATVMSQGTSFLLCFFYLYKNKEQFGFDFKLKSFRVSKKPLLTILKLGIPVAIQSSAGNISALFVSSYVNTYGVAYTAITGVGHKLNSIALIVANALNTSGAAIIGQSFGAGKTDRVKQVFYRVFTFDFIFVSALSTCILLFPEQIFGIFDSSDAIREMARLYAPVAAVAFMGFAFRSPSLALINGLGHSKINLCMGITEGLILRIGLTYLFGVVLGFGVMGFWYGSTIASYGYGLVVFPYFFSGAWKKHKSLAFK